MSSTLNITVSEQVVVHFEPSKLQMKDEEYDPLERKVHVYQPGQPVQVLDDPETVSGEPLLKGFALDVRALWD